MTYSSRFAAIDLHGWLQLVFAFLVMVTEALLRGLIWIFPSKLVRFLESVVSRFIPALRKGKRERERERARKGERERERKGL
jgi:hypothetical protein